MVKIYRFQRLMIAAAVIIWAVFAGRLVYKGIKGETMDVVDTFCENVYYDISADISATGKLDNGMSDTAKKLMMTQMAKALGLNRYNVRSISLLINLRLLFFFDNFFFAIIFNPCAYHHL